LGKQTDLETLDVKYAISKLLNCKLTCAERIGGGRNSKVYTASCGSRRKYAIKVYFKHRLDERDRQKVEFSSLEFLWANGVRCIPRPIISDSERRVAIYEYIDGQRISPQDVRHCDVDYAVQFLVELKKLKNHKDSRAMSPASEACFSGRAVIDSIVGRLDRLLTLGNDNSHYRALHDFLKNDFRPLLKASEARAKLRLDGWGMSFGKELEYEERTLSPSDFGFHNAIRRKDGKIAFVDFEYFGWDDPAKMVSDFLLHPGMWMHERLKKRFVRRILYRFKDHRCLEGRLDGLYPLFGLKWCLILLNEFVPENWRRRKFAGRNDLGRRGDLLANQLQKARQMLYRVRAELKHFPYKADMAKKNTG